MNIVEALQGEEAKLERELKAVKNAIAALNGDTKTVVSAKQAGASKETRPKRTMSAAVRAKISQKAKARWAKIRAKKAKKAK
jgi:hypothetical protein